MTELDLAVEALERAEDEYEQHIDRYGYDEKAAEIEDEIEDLEYRVEYLEECRI